MASNKVLLLGGIVLDRYFEVDQYPTAGQDTLIKRFFDTVGGCCLNVAATLKNLGDDPVIVDQYGQDVAGEQVLATVKALHLSTEGLVQAPCKNTGYCLNILSADGERTFFTFRGCEADFPNEVSATLQNQQIAFAYVIGYYLLNPETAQAVLALVESLRARQTQILFDPSPLVSEIDLNILQQMVACADWLVPNAAELATLQHQLTPQGDLFRQFVNRGGKGVVVKQGSSGQEVFTPDHSFKQKGYKVQVVDTTGAGDSFAGGLIHGLMNGYSLAQAVSIASACGAITTTFKGPHGVFDMEDVKKLMFEGGEADVK